MEVYNNLPEEGSKIEGIYFAQIYLIVLLSMLAVMHAYWWYWLMKAGIDMVIGKGIKNPHDKEKNVKS